MARLWIAATLAAATFAWSAAALAQNAAPAGNAANGKKIYMADGCYQCHGTVGQGGRTTGPHIAPNPIPYEAFAQQLRQPSNVMPPYTAKVLPDKEMADIYAYLSSIPPLPQLKDVAILNH